MKLGILIALEFIDCSNAALLFMKYVDMQHFYSIIYYLVCLPPVWRFE